MEHERTPQPEAVSNPERWPRWVRKAALVAASAYLLFNLGSVPAVSAQGPTVEATAEPDSVTLYLPLITVPPGEPVTIPASREAILGIWPSEALAKRHYQQPDLSQASPLGICVFGRNLNDDEMPPGMNLVHQYDSLGNADPRLSHTHEWYVMQTYYQALLTMLHLPDNTPLPKITLYEIRYISNQSGIVDDKSTANALTAAAQAPCQIGIFAGTFGVFDRQLDPDLICPASEQFTQGRLLFVSAGNYYGEIQPGMYAAPATCGNPNVFTAQALNQKYETESFSNYGPGLFQIVAGPGYNIPGPINFGGTSATTPQIAAGFTYSYWRKPPGSDLSQAMSDSLVTVPTTEGPLSTFNLYGPQVPRAPFPYDAVTNNSGQYCFRVWSPSGNASIQPLGYWDANGRYCLSSPNEPFSIIDEQNKVTAQY